jgi:hypothetical protein
MIAAHVGGGVPNSLLQLLCISATFFVFQQQLRSTNEEKEFALRATDAFKATDVTEFTKP